MSLNRNQKTVVVLALAIIFIMGICPPWNYTFKGEGFYSVRPAGYHFLLMPPETKDHRSSPRSRHNVALDFPRLFLQWFLVVVAGTSVIVFLGRGNVSRREDKKHARELRKKEAPPPIIDKESPPPITDAEQIFKEFARPKSNKHKQETT